MKDHSSFQGVILKDLAAAQATMTELSNKDWHVLREEAQKRVMANVPMEFLGKYRDLKAKELVAKEVRHVVESKYPGMAHYTKQSIVERLTNEVSGYGPLEKFLDNQNITEILIEKFDKVTVEENGELKETDLKFDSEEHLRLVAERIIAPLGRRLDTGSPIVDARLPDGSRVCALIPPVAPDGTQIAIRKFKPNVSIDNLVKWGMLPERLAEALAACVKARLNIIISGGTGSGKTTFLNALSEFIDPKLSIITIENPIEMQLRHPHVRRWEAKPSNMEDKGAVSMLDLLVAALRSRPDIIIVGEVRGKEAYVLMQALNTGHLGSMTTLHANDTREAMKRLVSMVASAGELAKELVPDYISSSVDLVIQTQRSADGKRRVTEIAQVLGEENGRVITNTLVEYDIIAECWREKGNEFSLTQTLKERGVKFPGWL